jgi:hypothetical protein
MFMLGAVVALLGLAVPPVAVVGTVVLVTGLVLALAAPVPAISAWLRNRDAASEIPP